MNKNILLYVLLLALSAFVASCSKEDYTNESTLTASDAKGTLTWTAPTSIVETDTVFPFTITLDKPQVADIHIVVSQVGGDAEAGTDFDVSDELIIPAFTTSVSGEFKIYNDAAIEGAETVTIKIGDNSLANIDFQPVEKTVEIGNAVGSALDLVFDWEGSAMVDGTEVSFCDGVDMDIYVFDVDQNDLGIYGAATGACPEHLVLDGWDNGDYYLWANLYANGIRPTDGSVVQFPITVSASQSGLFENETYNQAAANVITSADPDYLTDEANTYKPIIKVTVSGSNYTITVL